MVLVALLLAAYVLRSSDDVSPSGAELGLCADGVKSLASLVPEDGVPGTNLMTIKTAAIATSRHCEAPGTPSYCRTAARAAWNVADASRTPARREQALASFRRTQPRCLQELSALGPAASGQAALVQAAFEQADVERGQSASRGVA